MNLETVLSMDEPEFQYREMSENAVKILSSRYLLKGERTWEDVCQRVARFLASGMTLYPKYTIDEIREFEGRLYRALRARVFIFNSPCLFNAGLGVPEDLLRKPVYTMELKEYQAIYQHRNSHHNLSACFVIPVGNSIDEIYTALKRAAIISKVGGGVGYDFSKLSHKGRPLASGVGYASGPLSFIELFNSSAQAILQGGRRRAAQIGVLRIDHPDILEFIASKDEDGRLTFFNISVMVTKEFMEAVQGEKGFVLRDPVTGEPVRVIDARGLWEEIVHHAWKTGDPGLLFFDRINEDRYQEGYIEATNPCGEIPMYPNLSCNLGHINLAALVTPEGYVRWDAYRYLIHLGVVALNRVIDVAVFPDEIISRETRRYRPIGLGIMGFAHMLFLMRIRYGSEECLKLIEEIGRFLRDESIVASMSLAATEGSYPALGDGDYSLFKNSMIFKRFLRENDLSPEDVLHTGIRNATWNTIAPTGTCSLLCDTSSGIEPVFALVHRRHYIDHGEEKELLVLDPIYERWVKEHPNEEKPEYFVDAFDVTPEEHVVVQAKWQQYISNGVSKTINLPNHASEEDVKRVYRLAYDLGCKGVTIFRDGCKGSQVLYRVGATEDSHGTGRSDTVGTGDPRGGFRSGGEPVQSGGSGITPSPRPKTTRGFTTECSVACGTLYITMNVNGDGRPIETFLNTGKGGVCRANVEAVSRLTSLLLRSGVDRKYIVKQLKGIRCPVCMAQEKEALSCADALARVLEQYEEYLKGGEERKDEKVREEEMVRRGESELPRCPNCGGVLSMSEGCFTCLDCGESRCS